MKRLLLITLVLLVAFEAAAQTISTEARGLKGPVKNVLIEISTVSAQTGEPVGQNSIMKYQSSFDKEGRITEDIVMDGGGNAIEKTQFQYGSDDTMWQTRFRSDGTVEKLTLRYKYDASRRPIETLTFNGETLTGRSVRTYDAQGRFIEGSTYDADGTLSNRSVVTYDDSGKVKEFILYDGNGAVIHRQVPNEITYVNQPGMAKQRETRGKPVAAGLDSYGNWTRQTTPTTITRDGKSQEVLKIEKRTITYY